MALAIVPAFMAMPGTGTTGGKATTVAGVQINKR